MSKIKVLLVITVAVIAILCLLYFKYWKEPRAAYLQTDNPRLIKIRKDLNVLKNELQEKGLYNCCIDNDCNWCAVYMGHCPCAELISKKGTEESCPECAAAWNEKQGKIPGVDPDAIGVTTFGIYGHEEQAQHHH